MIILLLQKENMNFNDHDRVLAILRNQNVKLKFPDIVKRIIIFSPSSSRQDFAISILKKNGLHEMLDDIILDENNSFYLRYYTMTSLSSNRSRKAFISICESNCNIQLKVLAERKIYEYDILDNALNMLPYDLINIVCEYMDTSFEM